MPQAIYDYHYGIEAEQYAYFRIPKLLMTEPHFKDISTDAKLLYGLMLDRMGLSVKNGWLDDNERVYIYFTVEDVCDQLCCKKDKALKLFTELDTDKGIGLIERIRQGVNNINVIIPFNACNGVRLFIVAAQLGGDLVIRYPNAGSDTQLILYPVANLLRYGHR